jgi:ubiquinone/menaquinone biosynthesis C-methylase UbiE
LQLACRTLLGGNIFAPISSTPDKILDVGTGSGAWCVEVANQFPTANVFGLDLSPIHRKDTPENCQFMVGDLNEGIAFDTDSVDLVHSRYDLSFSNRLKIRFIRAGITKDQWPPHLREVFRIIKPGTGWIQAGEINPHLQCDDGSCPETATIYKVSKLISHAHCQYQQMMKKRIVSKNIYPNGEFLESAVKDAGFVDVKVKYQKLYPGVWALG